MEAKEGSKAARMSPRMEEPNFTEEIRNGYGNP